MKRLIFLCGIIALLAMSGCMGIPGKEQETGEKADGSLIQKEAATIAGRFLSPEGYQRVAVSENSFAAFLRNLPLKPHGSPVKYYNGAEKPNKVYEAVIDLDIGKRDLQQCADAVIRLRAEYLFQEKSYDRIHFNFTSGFKAEYVKWRQGYRPKVEGNSVTWVKSAGYSESYEDFRKYLDTVFAYAGTLSLAKELVAAEVEDMQIGDVFIQGGSPGHCAIVVDMVENPETGAKLFMLAQSYMPAQDIHILKNFTDPGLSPWHSLDFGEVLKTAEWDFQREDLKRFP